MLIYSEYSLSNTNISLPLILSNSISFKFKFLLFDLKRIDCVESFYNIISVTKFLARLLYLVCDI